MKLRTMGFAALMALVAAPAFAEPAVVASIKPINSLVAGVMKGVGTPKLIVQGGNSPHTYTMRPSDAEALQNADLVFWVGPDLEFFLEDALDTLPTHGTSIALERASGMTLLDPREGGMFEHHDHDHDHADEDHDHDHEHADEDHDHDHEHADEDHDHDHEHADEDHDHDHEHADEDHDHDHEHAEEDHADEHHHHEESIDPHLWLDPENAKAMVVAIKDALVEADPDNAEAYAENSDAMLTRLDDLIVKVDGELDGVRGKPFVVFHDAYHYFENRFAIEAAGSITVNPQTAPGAKRVAEIQEKLEGLDAACVFTEPQFDPKIVDTLIEGTNAKRGVMDPLGADLTDGPDLYFELLDNLAVSLKSCLQ